MTSLMHTRARVQAHMCALTGMHRDAHRAVPGPHSHAAHDTHRVRF